MSRTAVFPQRLAPIGISSLARDLDALTRGCSTGPELLGIARRPAPRPWSVQKATFPHRIGAVISGRRLVLDLTTPALPQVVRLCIDRRSAPSRRRDKLQEFLPARQKTASARNG